ncbi:hypothetical protein EDB19DRAFT_2029445 [Suillus lakei]|nr:hypothetical protein EDB19DRAFT_2029445 [Suillus lakei]
MCVHRIFPTKTKLFSLRFLVSAAEVRFSPVLCQIFRTSNRTTGSGSAVWSNSGPNVTERVREVRFAFEPDQYCQEEVATNTDKHKHMRTVVNTSEKKCKWTQTSADE